MRRLIPATLFIVSAVLGSSVAPADAAGPECFVRINLAATLSPTEPGKYIDAKVLPDCSVVLGAAKVVASPGGGRDTASTTCRFVNRMTGGGGEQDILTELSTWQDFTYDGSYIWSRNAYNTTAVSSGTGWYVYSGPTLSTWGVPPVTQADATGSASFGWLGSWHHDKVNGTHVYGNGDCTANFEHNGYVCNSPNPLEPCRVRVYIWRY